MAGIAEDDSAVQRAELNPHLRRYLWSLPSSPVGVLFWPGYLVSAIFFPTGFHSDSPMGFLVVAGLADLLIYSGVVFAAVSLVGHFRSRRSIQGQRER